MHRGKNFVADLESLSASTCGNGFDQDISNLYNIFASHFRYSRAMEHIIENKKQPKPEITEEKEKEKQNISSTWI